MNYKKNFNIKISTAINLISIVSLITIMTLSYIGYNKIQILNSNIDFMYNSDVKKIETSRTIATDIAGIHTSVKSQINHYDADLDSVIDSKISDLESDIKSYSALSSNKVEKENSKELMNMIDQYKKIWKNINSIVKSNNIVDEKTFSKLVVNEKMTIDSLGRLIQNNDKNAQEKYFVSQNTAKDAAKQYLVVSAVGFIILISISFAMIYMIKKSIKSMVSTMNIVAGGNLKVDINTDMTNEFGIMNRSLDKTVKSVSNMVSAVMNKTENIVNESKTLNGVANDMLAASKDVYSATRVMADGSTSQAQDLMNIDKQFNKFNEKLNMMIGAVNEIADHNENINELTKSGEENITILSDSSQKVKLSFNGFKEKFNDFTKLITQVNSIIAAITEIASQTQLLALNASIEAARAGEHGKGFAVVAEEVSKLSEESKNSADKITKLIETIASVTNDIVSVTDKMGSELTSQQSKTENITVSLKNIIESLGNSTEKIKLLSDSANDIINDKDKLIDRVVNASSIAEEISASAEEITASASQMDDYAGKLVNTANNLSGIVDETAEELNKFEV